MRQGSGTGAVVGDNSLKVTFCLARLVPARRELEHGLAFWDCETGFQGISAGWVDQYHHALEGQRLELTTAPNGVDLYLVSTSNFARKFRESDYTNNTEWVRFRLSQDSNGNRKVTVTGHSPCEPDAMCGIGCRTAEGQAAIALTYTSASDAAW